MSNNKEINTTNAVDEYSDYKTGLLCILGCQVFWGFCPVYWEALKPIPSWMIILYRIVTMLVYAYIAARIKFSKEEIWAPYRDRSVRLRYTASGLVLTANWSIYIWAMTTERVIQTSIGYYIEPIVICAVGILVFKEKLTKYNMIAMLFALASIIIILVHYGQLPGVAIGLACTWAIYSAIKKTADQPVLLSLVYETLPYAVIAIVAIIYIETKNIGVISLGVPGKYALLFLSGLITLIPIALFAVAAKKVPLYIVGLTQYISPTITLLLGIFAFGEPIDKTQILAFFIIWIGLGFFSVGQFRSMRKSV